MTSKQIQYIAQTTDIQQYQVQNTIQLFREGATLPFIARYRKEMTGSLDEVQIRDIQVQFKKMEEADKRRETVLKSIEEQGKLTPELRLKIENTLLLQDIEDIYMPYKQKRKTRASMAIERGLEPLAILIFSQKENNLEQRAGTYLNAQVPKIADAMQGARDIIAEWVNEDVKARNAVRNIFEREAVITSKVKKNKEIEGIKYQDYFDFSEALAKIPSHRLLAIRRGEAEGFLLVNITPEEDRALAALNRIFVQGLAEPKAHVELAIRDSYKRLLKPSIETEYANSSKEKADIVAIRVFSENLRQLLLASPLGQKRVLAIDPGYRTGCKTIALDQQGNLLADTVIYPFDKPTEAQYKILDWVERYKIEAIAIGNGTAGRETENFIKKTLQSQAKQPLFFMVSEQGASIYSASDVAREEFPKHDITVRGAISIGRRLLDPLAELVKIDPKSIGVGQYQHDVEQHLLKDSLNAVVESCVNNVGVNLNTASPHLLQYVSGLGVVLAKNIVEYRQEKGMFRSRKELIKVPRLGGKAFEQSAGFLRIENPENPLDNSAVHPESYSIVEAMAKDLNCQVNDLMQDAQTRKRIELKRYQTKEIGLPTLHDIVKELEKPSRDPRSQIQIFAFSDDIRTMEDLREGMELPGIVTNITAFGAFVDIGIKQDGLVHISQLSKQYITNPNQAVKLQQYVRVKVMEIDIARKRIALTMKF